MYVEIISKLISESLLSIYPIFVKKINVPIGLQIWSRCFSYFIISSFFINSSFIINNILSKDTLLLSLNTIFHIYFSYRGFQLLESGIAHALFYTYPIFILLLAGARIDFMIFFAILGVIMITMDKKDTPDQLESDKSKQETEYFWNEGVIMILLAALSEALIYFLVRRIKTDNNWNHLFLSYSLGSILFTALYFKNIVNNTIVSNLSLSVIINIFIGLFGHLLRFFAISKLDPIVYAPLSYFGIVMAYIYGILFNQEKITIIKMMGTLCILISNYYYSVI